MKINSNMVDLANYLKGVKKYNHSKEDIQVKTAANSVESDKVQISKRSKEIQRVREAVEASPDVRSEKVKELKTAVESGSYNVKGEAIAEEMIKRSVIDTLL